MAIDEQTIELHRSRKYIRWRFGDERGMARVLPEWYLRDFHMPFWEWGRDLRGMLAVTVEVGEVRAIWRYLMKPTERRIAGWRRLVGDARYRIVAENRCGATRRWLAERGRMMRRRRWVGLGRLVAAGSVKFRREMIRKWSKKYPIRLPQSLQMLASLAGHAFSALDLGTLWEWEVHNLCDIPWLREFYGRYKSGKNRYKSGTKRENSGTIGEKAGRERWWRERFGTCSAFWRRFGVMLE
jgi:hypothetical protein